LTDPRPGGVDQPQECDYCGSRDLEWVKCKLMCRNCRQMVLSCADLSAGG